jgi:hypothetical protein
VSTRERLRHTQHTESREVASGFEADAGRWACALGRMRLRKVWAWGADPNAEKAQGEHAMASEHAGLARLPVAWVTSSHFTA